MLESLQLVSGLPWETEGEALLVDALSVRGVNFHLSRLSDHELVSRDGADHPFVVLLLPILGDNDLTDEVLIRLTRLASCDSYRSCAILVVAHGDRHVSDEFVKPDTPFSIRVSRLFSGAGTFEMLETKLDRFTAAALAREILDIFDATNFSDVLELNCIARLLPRTPRWHARKRLLDFYDPCTGCSLLKSAERAIQKRIASHIQVIAPRILKMTHAGLGDDALADLGDALYAEVIDLGSNDFSWERLVPHLGACRWLGLAANSLTRMRLSQLPRGLEHLYLHKNDLHEFAAMPAEVERLKSLSLYRNRVTTLDWPAGQTALTRLNLGANPISSLPETLSDCAELEFLGLARTQISSLPEWVFSIQKLRELDISFIEDRIPPAQIAHLRARRVSFITRPGLVIP
jgi:hypothetical protein